MESPSGKAIWQTTKKTIASSAPPQQKRERAQANLERIFHQTPELLNETKYTGTSVKAPPRQQKIRLR